MEPPAQRRMYQKKRFLIPLVILLVVFFVFATMFVRSLRFMRETGLTPGLIVRLALDDGIALKSADERTNVLLLGVPGGDLAGADLTDSMIVLSLNKKNKSAALLSIPRDIWSDTLKDKVNSAYHYGEEKKKGGGILLSKVVAEDVIGMPIQYALLIDFSGFKEIVDLLGGIDVNVSEAFTDPDYPIAGKEHDTCPDDPENRCVYETIHFDAGQQHMDGERALKYVRSRHAEGDEGSDFARSRRQQEVLVALKEKIMSPNAWITFDRMGMLPTVFDRATDTDMNMGELVTIAKLYLKSREEEVKKISFEQLLTNPPAYLYGGRYVLVPMEDWQSIHAFITGELK